MIYVAIALLAAGAGIGHKFHRHEVGHVQTVGGVLALLFTTAGAIAFFGPFVLMFTSGWRVGLGALAAAFVAALVAGFVPRHLMYSFAAVCTVLGHVLFAIAIFT